MKFLTNLYNPNRWNARDKITTRIDETPEEAWASQEIWLADKVIGAPRATDTYTAAELRRMGMVGVYTEF